MHIWFRVSLTFVVFCVLIALHNNRFRQCVVNTQLLFSLRTTPKSQCSPGSRFVPVPIIDWTRDRRSARPTRCHILAPQQNCGSPSALANQYHKQRKEVAWLGKKSRLSPEPTVMANTGWQFNYIWASGHSCEECSGSHYLKQKDPS